MGKIQVRRGLQENVPKLVLSEGEFAVAIDTGNVYIGTQAGTSWVNPAGGTADTAVKLQTAREFRVTGDVISNAVPFDGTQAVILQGDLATIPGLTNGSYTKVSVDTKGRVTGGAQLTADDLPNIPAGKLTGLGSAALLDTGITAGKVVTVGADGKLAESLLPALAVSDTFEAANEAAMLALNAQRGDVCIRTDEGKSYILSASPATQAANWKWLKTPDCNVLSVNGRTGAVTITAAEVHTAASAKSAGLYKIAVDAYGHVTGATPAGKADITALGIPGQDTVYTLPAATSTTLGGVKVGTGLAVSGGTVSVGDIDGGTF